MVGISDVIGRSTFGFLADRGLFPKRIGYMVCIATSAAANLLAPFMTTFPAMVVYAVIYGYFSGAYTATTPVLLAEDLGTLATVI